MNQPAAPARWLSVQSGQCSESNSTIRTRACLLPRILIFVEMCIRDRPSPFTSFFVFIYFPLLIRASAGFSASSGMSHVLPAFWTPGIRPSLHRMPTRRDERSHFLPASVVVMNFIIRRSNEKLNSSSSWFGLVFSILSNFFEDTLYKSTLKSAIIRCTKSVCLHGKQTVGENWAKINSTCLGENFDEFWWLSICSCV